MKVNIKNSKQSPKKMRPVADLVRGKKVKQALLTLRFTNKKGANIIAKAINSAVANSKDSNKEDLKIKTICIDEGRVLKRGRSRAHGRVEPIKRKSSHIKIELS